MDGKNAYVLMLFVGASLLCASKKDLPHLPEHHTSSYPFITGDTFRSFCDYAIDEANKSIDPKKVKTGDTIFVQPEFLKTFFKNIHPKIMFPYILVTHNSPKVMPGPYESYLEDEKIIAWFAKNVGLLHPKLKPLPIGVVNKFWKYGNLAIIKKYMNNAPSPATRSTRKLVYLNFGLHTNIKQRAPLWDQFCNQPFVYCTKQNPYAKRLPFEQYLKELSQCRFVLSPRGVGYDCYRTWEAMLLNTIPIVRRSSADIVYQDLPVIVVDSWDQVTPEFLHQKYNEFQDTTFNLEKLYADYWFDIIREFQVRYRS